MAADALTWNESERTELIYGKPFMMAPPVRRREEISGELFGQLRDYLKRKKCKVYAAPFAVRQFKRNGDQPKNVDIMVDPNITVVCDAGKLDDIGCKVNVQKDCAIDLSQVFSE